MNSPIFDLYVDFLICSTSYTTATALSAATGNAVSHDKITRFLSSRDFTQIDLWQVAKPLVKTLQETDNDEDTDGVLILDDSIEEKPYTDENEVISWHYDHCKGRSVKGVNFISAMFNTRKGSSPVSYEPVRKNILVKDKKTGKEKRKAEVSKQEHFRNLIKVAIKNNVDFKTVLADKWFASVENMVFIKHDAKKDFILPIKDNRKVASSEENLTAGKFVNIKDLELGEGVLVWLEGVDFPLLLSRHLFKDEDGSTIALYLVSSNIKLSKKQIRELYQRRWKIEEYHKSLKNNASLSKSPTKTVRTQLNHLFTSICAFIRLERLSIGSKLNHFALKGKMYIQSLKTMFKELQKLKNQIFRLD